MVIEKAYAYFGATMLHAWGMTEMARSAPAAVFCRAMSILIWNSVWTCILNRAARSMVPRCVSSTTKDMSCRATGRSVGEIQVRGPVGDLGLFQWRGRQGGG